MGSIPAGLRSDLKEEVVGSIPADLRSDLKDTVNLFATHVETSLIPFPLP